MAGFGTPPPASRDPGYVLFVMVSLSRVHFPSRTVPAKPTSANISIPSSFDSAALFGAGMPARAMRSAHAISSNVRHVLGDHRLFSVFNAFLPLSISSFRQNSIPFVTYVLRKKFLKSCLKYCKSGRIIRRTCFCLKSSKMKEADCSGKVPHGKGCVRRSESARK